MAMGNRFIRSCGLILLMLWLAGCASQPAPGQASGVIHVVLLQFKADVTPQQRQALIRNSLQRLVAIPGVMAVEAGMKVRADRPVHFKDYDVGILVRLSSVEALDAYGPHPLHQAFVAEHMPLIARMQVIDFASEPLNPP